MDRVQNTQQSGLSKVQVLYHFYNKKCLFFLSKITTFSFTGIIQVVF